MSIILPQMNMPTTLTRDPDNNAPIVTPVYNPVKKGGWATSRLFQPEQAVGQLGNRSKS